MASYIEHAVRTLRESTAETQVRLLLGISDDHELVEDRVRGLGGTVHEQIGHATLEISVSENRVDDVCEIEGVKSVELDESDVYTHSGDVETGNL